MKYLLRFRSRRAAGGLSFGNLFFRSSFGGHTNAAKIPWKRNLRSPLALQGIPIYRLMGSRRVLYRGRRAGSCFPEGKVKSRVAQYRTG